MSDKQKPQNNVVEMHKKCIAEGCNAKDSRMCFCNEHFVWFKEGLITTKGVQVKDFEKKFQAFMHRKSKSA